MNSVLNIETWLVIATGVLVTLVTLAIRLGWRRGKGLGDK